MYRYGEVAVWRILTRLITADIYYSAGFQSLKLAASLGNSAIHIAVYLLILLSLRVNLSWRHCLKYVLL